jgi:hypothetical protein
MTEVLSVPWVEEVIAMGHTDEEIEAAASRFEELADELDPATAEVERTEDLRAIAAVSEAVRADEARLRPTYLQRTLDALETTLPRVSRVELPGVGHLAPDNTGEPERVASELRRFFGPENSA